MYINLKRIEFMVTLQCTGRCKHCSVSGQLNTGGTPCVDVEKACRSIEKLSKLYSIESLMTFGGEPLLYADTACSIHQCAARCGIGKRQLITNGYFSKKRDDIVNTAHALAQAEVNEILLSVDVFHQEYIPADIVHIFAKSVLESGVQKFRLSPAWVVDELHENPFNQETRKILDSFSDLNIAVSKGNNIFLAGNAIKYLSEYYEKAALDLSLSCGHMPYTHPLDDVQSFSIMPNGDVTVCHFVIGNILSEDVEDIVCRYDPYRHPIMRILLSEGIEGLVHAAAKEGIHYDTDKAHSICEVCRALTQALSLKL